MDITATLWSYCHVLRHDGVDYADYIEQLTYLLFLKMADENGIHIPENCKWKALFAKNGSELKNAYENALDTLKNESGILGQIFQEPISKIKNPTNLKKIMQGIENIGWTKLNKDVQGEAFEGLLEKTANEGKKGAGQFFTPRPLINAIVNVMKPDPAEKQNFKIADTSCGTAGFLTMAIEWAKVHTAKEEWNKLKHKSYYGQELVMRPYRLALMNLFLHGVRGNLSLGDAIYANSVKKNVFDCVLTNPPFGTRGTLGAPDQRSFKVQTSNIQINFIQHVFEVLKPGGRAAIVLPDSSLTDSKAREVWRYLMGEKICNVHTILRLPRGTFTPYANGVKACVVFFQKGNPTKNIWVYDARSNIEEITKASRPLNYEKHFSDFVKSYGNNPNSSNRRKENERFRKYELNYMVDRDYDLSISELYEPPKLEKPVVYVDRLIKNFEQQLVDLKKLRIMLESNARNEPSINQNIN